jgi:hypothetical protein
MAAFAIGACIRCGSTARSARVAERDWVQASPSCLVIVSQLQHLEQTAEGQLEQAWDDVGNWHEVTVIAGPWRFSDAG